MNEQVQLALGLLALLGAVVTFFKWVRPKYRAGKRDARAIRDTLLGRDALYDSITGIEIQAELPGIGQRVAATEENISVLAEAMAKLADIHGRVDDHDLRLSKLEKAEMDRSLARTEQIELLRTIESAIKATPEDQ